MKIAFVGKGGSGKTTVATLFTKFLNKTGAQVLAIDVDHNMDFMFNLGVDGLDHYLGDAMEDLLLYCGLDESSNYRDAFKKSPDEISFGISPMDNFTKKYSKEIHDGLHLMAAGPHTEKIFNDEACSHILGTPLKVYLPYLELKSNNFVILDEKAGADGVGTGISKGLDMAVLVVEPTKYGIKAAKQIASILNRFNVPYIYLINKLYDNRDAKEVIEEMGSEPAAIIPSKRKFANIIDEDLSEDGDELMGNLLKKIKEKVNN